MIPRELIGTAAVPGGQELRLFRHGGDFVIALGDNALMSSRMSGSENALALMTCARLAGRPGSRLLIGGYGMGFTLRAALAALGENARVTVAELVPDIIAWARGPMAALAAGCLDDPRVRLHHGDVAEPIRAAGAGYDAILLDVDNGPDGLTRDSNGWLYSMSGLAAAKAALAPGGILAIWSAAPDRAFAARLRQAGFKVDEAVVRARSGGKATSGKATNGKTTGGKGARHVIWLAQKG